MIRGSSPFTSSSRPSIELQALFLYPQLLIFQRNVSGSAAQRAGDNVVATSPKNPRRHSAYSDFYLDASEPPSLNYPSGRGAKIAGAALFAGVVQFALAMFLAAFLYPGYSVSGNTI